MVRPIHTARLLQVREAAIARLPTWTLVIRGSLTRCYLTCGKKSCRCHADKAKRHGPYWYVSVPKGKGRNRSYLLAPALVPLARKGTAAYKRLWKGLCRISDTNLALLRSGAWRPHESTGAGKQAAS